MKFISGLLIGFVLGIITVVIASGGETSESNNLLAPNETIDGLNLFAEQGDCMTNGPITIFQTLFQNVALAEYGDPYDGQLVLILNYEGLSYYDNQKISISNGMCARQLGTYSYETKMGVNKTVPVVIIK